jgi:hypothetical protein
MQTARNFYGQNYDKAADQTKLDAAFKYLNTAIVAEAENMGAKLDMALKQACKRELEGYGLSA